MTISKTMLTLIDTVKNTMEQSLTRFVENLGDFNLNQLGSELVSAMFGGLEDALMQAGRAGMKQFIESYESTEGRIERGGRIYSLRDRACGKEFLTLFGPFTVERRYYHNAEAGGGIYPLDEAWAMGGRYATPEVVGNVLWAGSLMTAKESSEAFARLAAFAPSVACIQDILSKDGGRLLGMLEGEIDADADADQSRPGRQASSRHEEVPEETEIFVASLDGANLLMRGRRKSKLAKEGGEGEGEGEAGEEEQGYRNAMVGSFSCYSQGVKAIDIETGLEGLKPQRLTSHYIGRMPEKGAVRFKEEFEVSLGRMESGLKEQEKKTGQSIERILILDGARPLWKYVENTGICAEYRMLLDYYHATEHLRTLSGVLFGTEGKDGEKAKEWYEEWAFKLKYERGAVAGILRSSRRYRMKGKRGKKRESEIRKQETYFKRNRKRMNYHEHVAKGWPIGSGVVEAACKTIVKARMCQSGMRWTKAGGEIILALRAVHQSGQWDNVWATYRSSTNTCAA